MKRVDYPVLDTYYEKVPYKTMNRYKPKYAIRISTKNFGFENNIKSLPLYVTFLIK